jgi:hypothetical protein
MNSYDNAEPKPLKFLVSDGKLVDESGNVIAESDPLQDLYIKSSPQVKKYLLSDGSVVDENNNLIIKNDYYKKVYDQATPKVAKYLHSDGTIDENPGSGGGGSDLEDNKEETIDVSTYTEPVEITPTEGKDGMKKVTVTLSNIPSPSGGTYNAYYCSGGGISTEWAFTKETMTPESTSFTGVIIADNEVYIYNNAPISYEYHEESGDWYWGLDKGPDLYFDEDWQNNFKQIVTF